MPSRSPRVPPSAATRRQQAGQGRSAVPERDPPGADRQGLGQDGQQAAENDRQLQQGKVPGNAHPGRRDPGRQRANEYDKSLAAQLASQAAYQTDDVPGAIAYLKQVMQFNGLDNNGHFQSMLMLGQLQLQEDKTAEGLATLDKYFAESKSTKPEELIAKGQALYQLERYQEAIPVLKQAIAGAAEPKDNWNQLLMAALSEAGQTGEAVRPPKRWPPRTRTTRRPS
jgi:tetratricopeptide (TPR) repeat protein